MSMVTMHISLIDLGPGCAELRYWRDNPNEHTARTLQLAEIADLVTHSESHYYALKTPNLVEMGRRLFRWLDGSDRWMARELELSRGMGAVALMIQAQAGLGHLPWETLHDGTGFLIAGTNPRVLPIRWKPRGSAAAKPRNRALNALFMATSPLGVEPDLAYEEEESRILQATRRFPMSLVVEESGNLDEVGQLVRSYGAEHFDVFHLTGHADHTNEGPRFLTETLTGEPYLASGEEIARALPHKPPLVFLSGCRTGQSPAAGAVRSLAEELLDHGFHAVLGWGRPVFDIDAITAAEELYRALSSGGSLVESLLDAHTKLREVDAEHWHLMRLFVAGEIPQALVTSPRTPGRKSAPRVSSASRFLDPDKRVKVADREGFVGRRRPLQRLLHVLRAGAEYPAGVVVYGMGGVGKSSVACRLCDRLGDEFEPVIHVGVLDEPGFLRSLEPYVRDADLRTMLQSNQQALRYRLQAFLEDRRAVGGRPLLFVLDDYEQNTPLDDTGTPLTRPEAQQVLEALVWSIEQTGAARCLITSRYALATSQAHGFYQEMLVSMRGSELEKKLRTIEEGRKWGALTLIDPTLRDRAILVADGNPRLLEWLFEVLSLTGLNHESILQQMEEKATEFRTAILARELLSSLSDVDQRRLAALLVFQLPVPFEAVNGLFSVEVAPLGEAGGWDGELQQTLLHVARLGLVEVETDGESAFVYKVSRILEPLLEPSLPADRVALVRRAAEVLYQVWWRSDHPVSEMQALEILRLALEAQLGNVIVPMADAVGTRWLDGHRYLEAKQLYDAAIASAGRDYRLLGGEGRAERVLGDGQLAARLLEEAMHACPAEDVRERLYLAHQLVDSLVQRGDLDTALSILEDDMLPACDHLKDVRSRAATLGQIADVLYARGQLDEALRIRQEEGLPVYQRLGDLRSQAVTMGKIADILYRRGQLDEALRIRQEEQLPVFEQLGDVRERAVTLGKIADILYARGQLDEALRIRQEEQIPVYERLGDVREWAVAQGRIADILYRRGQLDEALRIRQEEQIPVYERLGDVRSRAVTQGRIADILFDRGQLDEALCIRQEEELPVYERLGDVRSRAVALGKIADILYQRCKLDEALRLWQEEQLPVYERLGDVYSRAVTLGRIADVLFARGQLDEALRIRQEEQLPVYERLGDVRSRAVALGKIADILFARGQLDEALRIRQEEQLPVYERLGDVRSRAVALGKIADTLFARGQLDEALRIRQEEELPVYERLGDVFSRTVTQGKIADILYNSGELDEALRIRQEQLPVFERVRDVANLVACRTMLALMLVRRGRPEDAPTIRDHLQWSLETARATGMREAKEIEKILQEFMGIDP